MKQTQDKYDRRAFISFLHSSPPVHYDPRSLSCRPPPFLAQYYLPWYRTHGVLPWLPYPSVSWNQICHRACTFPPVSSLHLIPSHGRCNQIWVCSPLPLCPFFRSAPPLSPICPQPNQRSLEEELIGLPGTDIPRQVLVQDEFDCLNLNITAPARQGSLSRLPVMIWVHGLVFPSPRVSSNSFRQGRQPRVWL